MNSKNTSYKSILANIYLLLKKLINKFCNKITYIYILESISYNLILAIDYNYYLSIYLL